MEEAHFWEKHAFRNTPTMTNGGLLLQSGDADPDGSNYLKSWNERAINVMTGQGTIDRNAICPAIDWSLFNQDGDNTAIYVMTPQDKDNRHASRYDDKIKNILSTIRNGLSNSREGISMQGVADLTYRYQPLTYSTDGNGNPAPQLPKDELENLNKLETT